MPVLPQTFQPTKLEPIQPKEGSVGTLRRL